MNAIEYNQNYLEDQLKKSNKITCSKMHYAIGNIHFTTCRGAALVEEVLPNVSQQQTFLS